MEIKTTITAQSATQVGANKMEITFGSTEQLIAAEAQIQKLRIADFLGNSVKFDQEIVDQTIKEMFKTGDEDFRIDVETEQERVIIRKMANGAWVFESKNSTSGIVSRREDALYIGAAYSIAQLLSAQREYMNR